MKTVRDLRNADFYRPLDDDAFIEIVKSIASPGKGFERLSDNRVRVAVKRINLVKRWYNIASVTYARHSPSARKKHCERVRNLSGKLLQEFGATASSDPLDVPAIHMLDGVFSSAAYYPEHLIAALQELHRLAVNAESVAMSSTPGKPGRTPDLLVYRTIDDLGWIYMRLWGNVSPSIDARGRGGHAMRFMDEIYSDVTGDCEDPQFFKDRVVALKKGSVKLEGVISYLTPRGGSRLRRASSRKNEKKNL